MVEVNERTVAPWKIKQWAFSIFPLAHIVPLDIRKLFSSGSVLQLVQNRVVLDGKIYFDKCNLGMLLNLNLNL